MPANANHPDDNRNDMIGAAVGAAAGYYLGPRYGYSPSGSALVGGAVGFLFMKWRHNKRDFFTSF
jgi:hypothetical protein